MLKIIFPVVSYLTGSIPFGFLLVRLIKKKDIRTLGSCNIGATNVSRVMGKGWGVLVFILDFFKGFLPIFLAQAIIEKEKDPTVLVIMALAGVCGHNWSIFLGFKGGKGVATSMGVISALAVVYPELWIIIFLAITGWWVVFWVWRYVSLASLSASFLFLILSFFLLSENSLKVLALLLFVFILFRHRKNIRNLLTHKEPRL